MRLGLFGLLIAGMTIAAMPSMAASALYAGVRSPVLSVELSAQTVRRPRIMIYPRRTRPGPNAKRVCRSQLVREYRASGTVIVPQTRCWWR